MDKTITTALMIVISMITALMLFNVVYPAVVQGGDAINNMAYRMEVRMSDQVSIIHAAAELDADGWWQDTNANAQFEVFVWAKNIGSSTVLAVNQLDIFFGPEGNFARIPHESNAGGSYPYWTAQVETGTDWKPTSTLKITVHYNAALASGRYFIKVTLPSGVSDDYFMGM